MKRYILTGTPGSGKTSLLVALKSQGYVVVEEAATDIIASEQRQENPEPWHQPDFIDNIVRLQHQRQISASKDMAALQFYDRSPLCTYALCRYLGYVPSTSLAEKLERIEREHIYQKQAFFNIDVTRRPILYTGSGWEHLPLCAYWPRHCMQERLMVPA